jgi:hypothetical protein
MKTSLKISLLLNLGLIGCLVWVLNRTPETNNQAAAPSAADSRQDQQPAGGTDRLSAPAPPGAEGKPFHWSQLESPDYRSYVANLRGIGCPEQTIRDIITADLDGLYATRREALQRKLAAAESSTASLAARHGIETALASLRDEEAATLAALLGPGTSPNQTAPEPSPTQVAAGLSSTATRRRTTEATEVSTPLVFQEADVTALKLNNREVQAMSDLKQMFMDQIGGPDQDPNDAGYRERWLKAQPVIDNMTRGMIGVNAFQNYQLATRARQQQVGAGQ